MIIQKIVRSFFNENKMVIGENKMVIEKMKDEAAEMLIQECIGLRSKMYSYEINNKATKNVREYLNRPHIKL